MVWLHIAGDVVYRASVPIAEEAPADTVHLCRTTPEQKREGLVNYNQDWLGQLSVAGAVPDHRTAALGPKLWDDSFWIGKLACELGDFQFVGDSTIGLGVFLGTGALSIVQWRPLRVLVEPGSPILVKVVKVFTAGLIDNSPRVGVKHHSTGIKQEHPASSVHLPEDLLLSFEFNRNSRLGIHPDEAAPISSEFERLA
jgi:hypothetical protein